MKFGVVVSRDNIQTTFCIFWKCCLQRQHSDNILQFCVKFGNVVSRDNIQTTFGIFLKIWHCFENVASRDNIQTTFCIFCGNLEMLSPETTFRQHFVNFRKYNKNTYCCLNVVSRDNIQTTISVFQHFFAKYKCFCISHYVKNTYCCLNVVSRDNIFKFSKKSKMLSECCLWRQHFQISHKIAKCCLDVVSGDNIFKFHTKLQNVV